MECNATIQSSTENSSEEIISHDTSGPCNSDETQSYFLQIPQEILLHIFSFIDAEYLLNSVANVCSYLRHLLHDEEYWKIRHFKQFPKPYPIINDSYFSWIEACKQRETCRRTWKSKDLSSGMITLCKASGSGIDAVHLTENNLCICGGRDRSITWWKLRNESNYEVSVPEEFKPEYLHGHNGWVWSISSHGDEFCSTSFDSTVRLWDLPTLSETGGLKQTVKTKSAVLCSSYLTRDVVIVGCFNKEMLIIDGRSGEIVQDLPFHKRSVLCIASNDNAIVSSGENGSIILLDKRNLGLLQEKKVEDTFCMSLDLHNEQLWTGSRNGSVGAYDLHDLTDIKLVESFDYSYNGKITGIRYTHGAVYSGSTDGCIKIFQPSYDPELIASKYFLGGGGIADISVRGQTLAASTSEGLVALWNP